VFGRPVTTNLTFKHTLLITNIIDLHFCHFWIALLAVPEMQHYSSLLRAVLHLLYIIKQLVFLFAVCVPPLEGAQGFITVHCIRQTPS